MVIAVALVVEVVVEFPTQMAAPPSTLGAQVYPSVQATFAHTPELAVEVGVTVPEVGDVGATQAGLPETI